MELLRFERRLVDAKYRPGMVAFRLDRFALLSRSFQFATDGAPGVLFYFGRAHVRPPGSEGGDALDSGYFGFNRSRHGPARLVQAHSGVAHLFAWGHHVNQLGLRAARAASVDPSTGEARRSC